MVLLGHLVSQTARGAMHNVIVLWRFALQWYVTKKAPSRAT